MTDANPQPVTLAPGQVFNGQAFLANAPAGGITLRAQYLQLPQCSGAVKRDDNSPGKLPCKGGALWGEGFAFGNVHPDEDHDGLGDDYENQLLNTFAPLLLFSYDHQSEEQYAPIDVLDFIRASELVSKEADVPNLPKSTLTQNPFAILNPSNAASGANAIGTINPMQQALGAVINNGGTDTVPRMIYVSPSSAAQHGAAWATVMARKNVGLYGHVVPLDASQVANNAGQPFDDSVAQLENQTLANELIAKLCDGNDPCQAKIFKIEYWQFFGYSHDFEDPIPGTQGISADVIDHGGDWCSVQLLVDANTAFTKPDQSILAVYHFAHGLRFGFDMQRLPIAGGVVGPSAISGGLKAAFTEFSIKQFQGPNSTAAVSLPYQGGKSTQDYKNAQNNVMQLAKDASTGQFSHPVVYVEWGGHEFWPDAGWSLSYASKHGGDGKYRYIANSVPNVGEVGSPMANVPQAQLVTGFAGFWGYYGWENRNKPPPGPPLHAEWLWNPTTDPSLLKQRPSQNPPPW